MRLPESLHNAVREIAEKENISINQFITIALAEKISALTTEDYSKEHAERGSREKFEAALKKVPSVEPPENDKL